MPDQFFNMTDSQCQGDDENRVIIPEAAAIAHGQVVYVDSTGRVNKALADSPTTMPAVLMKIANGRYDWKGIVASVGWSWTPGGLVYVSSSVAGGLTQTAPSAGGTYAQVVGVALTATTMLLCFGQYMKAN